MRRFVPATLAVAVFSFSSGSVAWAASFASEVVSYTSGNGAGPYTNPQVALGAPEGVTGENAAAAPYYTYSGSVNVLSPFNSAYQNDEFVVVGEGGSITLRLARNVRVGEGAELGLVENVILYDPNYPSATTGNPATVFGADTALVEVSQDGQTFRGLTGGAATSVLFNIPANYYLNAGPFDAAPPADPQLADFGKPFTGGLSAFDGKGSYQEVLDVLAGSGGGTWFDASGSGLTEIAFVRFSMPDDNNPATTRTLEVDSVLSNTSLLVPEPTAVAMLAMVIPFIARRRR